MDKLNIEEYIKDLSPELQEKARACKSLEELSVLAEENDIPIPDNAVEAIAGGGKEDCPKGGKHDWKESWHSISWITYTCTKCGKSETLENDHY